MARWFEGGLGSRSYGLFQRFKQKGKKDGGNRYDFEPRIAEIVARLNNELGPKMQHGYWLIVNGPLDRKLFADLERRIRDYIASGNTQEEALDAAEILASTRKQGIEDASHPAFPTSLNERARVRMKGTTGQGIFLMSSIHGSAKIPNSNELVANVQASLDNATTYIVAKKMPRLAKVSGYDRKALLVWKAMPLVQAAEIGNSFASKIDSGLDGIFLYEHGPQRISLILDLGLMKNA